MRLHLCAALIAVAMMSASLAAAATPKEVDDAIIKLKAELYDVQANGNWDAGQKGQQYEGGYTALATYALLAAGEDPQDPRMQQAIAYLLAAKCSATYVISLRCQVWLNLRRPYTKEVEQALARDGQWLLAAAKPDPNLRGGAFYTYTADVKSPSWDASNSQFGVLGVWACAQADLEIPRHYWQAVDWGWRAHQHRDGGWCYSPGPIGGKFQQASSGSMTAAGVATLFITQDYLHSMDGIECHGNSFDANIEAGLDWMGKNFQSIYHTMNFAYALYAVSRIGVASGRKYLGPVDWFQEGADYILKEMANPTGFLFGGKLNPQMIAMINQMKVRDDSFELLFLARGRAPVMMNKLQYDLNMHGDKPREANWNERPRDAANITKWVSKQNEHYLNWQIVNLKTPIDDLHDSPILYIAGNQPVDFTDAELAKLRQFVLEGGLIFANSDCNNLNFVHAIHRMCQKLFPDYEFRDLPEDSPIYVHEQFQQSRWKNKPKVEALGNGAREWVILCPSGDPARFWQTQTVGGHEDTHQLMADIVLYTVNRGEEWNRLNRGETFQVRADPAVHPSQTISVARLQYGGTWDPEPGGWTRLAAILHNTQDADLNTTAVKLGEGKLNNTFKVAHLTGAYAFTLAPEAREEIRKYVEAGGTLIVDACGGNHDFADSAAKELAAIFPAAALSSTPLPQEDRVFASGPSLGKVAYRAFAKKVVGNLSTPRIRAITINGRAAVFHSAEDLSCGMVGMPVDGIFGYDPASATLLMEKLVLWSAGLPGRNPATAPTTIPSTEPTTNPATSSATNPTTSPATSPTTNPTTNPTTSPATNPATGPTTDPALPLSPVRGGEAG